MNNSNAYASQNFASPQFSPIDSRVAASHSQVQVGNISRSFLPNNHMPTNSMSLPYPSVNTRYDPQFLIKYPENLTNQGFASLNLNSFGQSINQTGQVPLNYQINDPNIKTNAQTFITSATN